MVNTKGLLAGSGGADDAPVFDVPDSPLIAAAVLSLKACWGEADGGAVFDKSTTSGPPICRRINRAPMMLRRYWAFVAWITDGDLHGSPLSEPCSRYFFPICPRVVFPQNSSCNGPRQVCSFIAHFFATLVTRTRRQNPYAPSTPRTVPPCTLFMDPPALFARPRRQRRRTVSFSALPVP